MKSQCGPVGTTAGASTKSWRLIWLTLTCSIAVCTQDAVCAPSAADLAKLLESSGTLQKGYKCSVSIDGNVATISSYHNMTSKNPDNDCKIDSVLLAKKVFDSRSDLTRVKVKWFDPRGSGNCRTISLSLGDISAYSAGTVTMPQLLSSLELLHETATPPPKPSAGSSTSSSSSKARHITTL